MKGLTLPLGFFQTLPKTGNLVVSPLSVYPILSMVTAGARGETREELNRALGTSGISDGEIIYHVAELLRRVKKIRGVTIETANRLYLQAEMKYNPLLMGLFGAVSDPQLVDFTKGGRGLVPSINLWVSEQTRGKIPALLGEGAITDTTRWLAVNASYFKGLWLFPFPQGFTESRKFTLEGGNTLSVPTMYQKGMFYSGEGRNFRVLSLPFEGCETAMAVFLPNPGVSTAEIEEEVFGDFQKLLLNLSLEEFYVFLPRWETRWGTYSLNSALSQLGINLAFTPRADFSGIDGTQWLYLSQVFHQCCIKVDETGAEAAAGSAASVSLKAITLTKTFRADRPFLYAIYDGFSHFPYFVGRVSDPTRVSA